MGSYDGPRILLRFLVHSQYLLTTSSPLSSNIQHSPPRHPHSQLMTFYYSRGKRKKEKRTLKTSPHSPTSICTTHSFPQMNHVDQLRPSPPLCTDPTSSTKEFTESLQQHQLFHFSWVFPSEYKHASHPPMLQNNPLLIPHPSPDTVPFLFLFKPSQTRSTNPWSPVLLPLSLKLFLTGFRMTSIPANAAVTPQRPSYLHHEQSILASDLKTLLLCFRDTPRTGLPPYLPSLSPLLFPDIFPGR